MTTGREVQVATRKEAASFRAVSSLVSTQEAAIRTGLSGSGIELTIEYPNACKEGLVSLDTFIGAPATFCFGASAQIS